MHIKHLPRCICSPLRKGMLSGFAKYIHKHQRWVIRQVKRGVTLLKGNLELWLYLLVIHGVVTITVFHITWGILPTAVYFRLRSSQNKSWKWPVWYSYTLFYLILNCLSNLDIGWHRLTYKYVYMNIIYHISVVLNSEKSKSVPNPSELPTWTVF